MMQLISAAVGEGGTNVAADVALVQAILVKTQRAAAPGRVAGPYLAKYDGTAGAGTTAAIKAFQADHVFVSATGDVAANPGATDGQVKPKDATWTKLLEKVPSDFADMRVLKGGKTVYVAATSSELQAKLTACASKTFTTTFRAKVTATMNLMHTQHGVAIGVCPQGDRRTFQAQYVLRTSGRGVTNAGPGESNHNFGMAVDLGLSGLKWLKANGTLVTNEDDWLHQLDKVSKAQSAVFWAALRAAGIASAAYRGPVGDLPHLQNWADAGVSMAARLGALLTSAGTMRWTGRGARPASLYTCDLGLGGDLIEVGTAVQIWNNEAAISATDLARVQAAFARRPRAPGSSPPVPPPSLTTVRQQLRAQFDLADAAWTSWTSS
jgi:hypothetical protein